MTLNIEQMYQCVRNFDFANLLISYLHWSRPRSERAFNIDDRHERREIARIAGVPVFEIYTYDGEIPPLQMRDALDKELSSLFDHCLLVFLDKERMQSIWYWHTHENGWSYRHEYRYDRGQPVDFFLQRLNAIISDLTVPQIIDISYMKQDNLSISTRFVTAFEAHRLQFSEQIEGIEDTQTRSLYAVILLTRLIFLYFLEKRGFLHRNDTAYLEHGLQKSSNTSYYHDFLCPLFFEGIAKSLDKRTEGFQTAFGSVPYIGGSMFHPHAIERDASAIQIPNTAFTTLFSFFSNYEWRLIEIPARKTEHTAYDGQITPDVIGDIFEIYFNRRTSDYSSSTPLEIKDYLCRQTIDQFLLDKINQAIDKRAGRAFRSVEELLDRLDRTLCRSLVFHILPDISILDPACGSGTFLASALDRLLLVYYGLIEKIESFNDPELHQWLTDLQKLHPNILYSLKKRIAVHNLFGVDMVEEAIEITRLRLYLKLIASLNYGEEMENAPDFDFHLYTGNSLIGLLRLNQGDVIDSLPLLHEDSYERLHNILLTQLDQLYQKRKGRRELSSIASPTINDVEKLSPFHWCCEFASIMDGRGGFDVIITNPPWKRLKLDSSPTHFYQSLIYQSIYPHALQNISFTTIQKTSILLHSLFVERCYNLLSDGGYCGMIVPGGIRTNRSESSLREFLFQKTQLTGLFCFKNSNTLFEGLDARFEFVLLTYKKGTSTDSFPAAFEKQAIEGLEYFPEQGGVSISTNFLRRFSPDLLAINTFTSQKDIQISEKILCFPQLADSWQVKLQSGAHIGAVDHGEFTSSGPEALPLYEGKMIQQFTHTASPPRLWVSKTWLKQQKKQKISPESSLQLQWETAQQYKLAFRRISSGTNQRTLIATVLPLEALASHSLGYVTGPLDADDQLFLTALFNSFIVDYFVRLQISMNVSSFVVSRLPVPTLHKQEKFYMPIVKRTARLICTTPEFKELWKETMAASWSSEDLLKNAVARTTAQAELDGMITHLYNITEDELAYILSTFPLVAEPIKIAVQNAYRDAQKGLLA